MKKKHSLTGRQLLFWTYSTIKFLHHLDTLYHLAAAHGWIWQPSLDGVIDHSVADLRLSFFLYRCILWFCEAVYYWEAYPVFLTVDLADPHELVKAIVTSPPPPR